MIEIRDSKGEGFVVRMLIGNRLLTSKQVEAELESKNRMILRLAKHNLLMGTCVITTLLLLAVAVLLRFWGGK